MAPLLWPRPNGHGGRRPSALCMPLPFPRHARRLGCRQLGSQSHAHANGPPSPDVPSTPGPAQAQKPAEDRARTRRSRQPCTPSPNPPAPRPARAHVASPSTHCELSCCRVRSSSRPRERPGKCPTSKPSKSADHVRGGRETLNAAVLSPTYPAASGSDHTRPPVWPDAHCTAIHPGL